MQIKRIEPSASLLTAEMCELGHDDEYDSREAVAEVLIHQGWYTISMCDECLERLLVTLHKAKEEGVF